MTNLLSQVSDWVANALYTIVTDEELNEGFLDKVNYAVNLTAFPDPSSLDEFDNTAFVPAFVLFLEIPSLEEGETVYAAPIIAPFALHEDRVKHVVRKTLESLREARDKKQVDNSESDT